MEDLRLKYYDFSVLNDKENQRNFLFENDGLYNIGNKYLVLNIHGRFYSLAFNLREGETCPNFLVNKMPYPINCITKVQDLRDKNKRITPDRLLEKYFCNFHKCTECPLINDFGVCVVIKNLLRLEM